MQKWNEKEYKFALCCMDLDGECPRVFSCIIVNQNLFFTVYVNNIKINEREFPHKGRYTINKILEDLILRIKSERGVMQFAVFNWTINFIASSKYGEYYTNQTMVFVSCLFVHSSKAYFVLIKSGFQKLTHLKNLQKLIKQASIKQVNRWKYFLLKKQD